MEKFSPGLKKTPLKLTLITLKEHFNEACNLRCLSVETGKGGGGVVPFSLKFPRRKCSVVTLTAVIKMLRRACEGVSPVLP